MAADERLHVHRAGELDVEITRVGQHPDKAVDAHHLAVRIGKTTDLGPVALGLLPGRGLVAHREGKIGLLVDLQAAEETGTICVESVKPRAAISSPRRTAERPCTSPRSRKQSLKSSSLLVRVCGAAVAKRCTRSSLRTVLREWPVRRAISRIE